MMLSLSLPFSLSLSFPQFAQAFSPQVWLEAATQIFFSLGLSLGVLIALASYSKPRYNTLVDSFIVCLTNSLTSIFSSIIVFSIVGFRAHQLNVAPSLVSYMYIMIQMHYL